MARTPLARPTDAPPTAHLPTPRLRSDRRSRPRRREPLLPAADLPRHVAIIMDGNRRWARQQGLAELRATPPASRRSGRSFATPSGAASRRDGLRVQPRELGPSDDEVRGLFALLEQAIRSETAELKSQGVRIRLLGRLDELPDDTRRSSTKPSTETAGGDRLLLNVAFNYAGRTELVDAFRRLAASGIAPESIDETTIAGALYTAGLPDPDLVIRTGGEQRLRTS